MSSRQYAGYCLGVCLALVVIKLWVGTLIPSSPLFEDDHEYLNRSIYLLQGNVGMTDYPFSKLPYGPLYPLLISPWMLFADPSTRLTVVFAVNAALSATTVLFASLTVFRLTGSASLLAPLCLAAFAPLFQFSFYAMSENLLFPLLAVVGWLVVDFDDTCKNPLKLAALLMLVLLLPLVRVPGLAVVPALLLLLWVNSKLLLGGRPRALAGGLAVFAPVVSYYVFYRLAVDSGREAAYLSTLKEAVSDPGRWLLALKLAVSQTGYLLFSTGYWVLPVLVVVALQFRGSFAEPFRQRWWNYLIYAGVSSGAFLFFAIVHLMRGASFTGADFIYGRYSDPAGLLLLIGGLGGVLTLRPQTSFQRFLLRVVAPLALSVVLARLAQREWVPVNQSGLALFTTGFPALWYLLPAVVVAVLLNQLSDRPRWYAPAALVFFLAFSVLTDFRGTAHTMRRARKGAHSLEAASWIASNVPTSATIGYDATILKAWAPRGVKKMANVYRAMMFRTHPRGVAMVGSREQLGDVDYLYTAAWTNDPRGLVLVRTGELTEVWTNGDYALHRVKNPQE